MKFLLDAACGCDKGKVRGNNEDNLFFSGVTLEENNDGLPEPLARTVEDKTVCFGVFDGMGGADDGQTASFLAARSFLLSCDDIDQDDTLTEDFFIDAIERMNRIVYEEADRRGSNMGCTAVMIGFSDSGIIVCNVGDSRAYRCRDGRLTQITMDHCERLMSGAARKPRLTQCIGLRPERRVVEPYTAVSRPGKGDIWLLCSDGLTDMVPEGEIAAILREEENAAAAVTRLIDRALANGGVDNTTVIVIRVTDCEEIDPEDL